jgi:plastocyanin
MLSVLLAFGLAAAAKAATPSASVAGKVIYEGPVPAPIPVVEAQTKREVIERDAKTNGLQDAVVWLEGPAIHRDPNLGRDLEPATMDQSGYFFVPHVLAIRAGQRVEFHNSDAANHAIMAASLVPQNTFNVVTPTAGAYVHRFVRDPRPVAISCPIHPGMAAWIVVFDHPFYAVTDEHGDFEIPKVPAGSYTLHVRHPSGGMTKRQPLTAKPGEPLQLRIELEMRAKGKS